MFSPYWAYNESDFVMNQIELGFEVTSDESSPMLHRFSKATGVPYDLSHNYWSRVIDRTGR